MRALLGSEQAVGLEGEVAQRPHGRTNRVHARQAAAVVAAEFLGPRHQLMAVLPEEISPLLGARLGPLPRPPFGLARPTAAAAALGGSEQLPPQAPQSSEYTLVDVLEDVKGAQLIHNQTRISRSVWLTG
jgi:hypothetical protein